MMPPRAPLARTVQDLAAGFRDPRAPTLLPACARLFRLAVFVPTILITALLVGVFLNWFRPDGLRGIEVFLVSLIGLAFFWIAFSVSTASVGILAFLLTRPEAPTAPPPAMTVALLVPIYSESPADVFGNAAAMLEDLARQPLERPGGQHRFDLFLLSDTRDDDIARCEREALKILRAMVPAGMAVFYRRRVQNTDRKSGNIADWVEGWGADYPAMLVLDADSLMTGAAIVALSDALAGDPTAGIVQSFPTIFAAGSLFGRVQQFSGRVYGPVLARGLAAWSASEGNFWGHNAILRTRAFAECAGLPHLRGWRPGSGDALILSHDFVEAALMRRAGWAVRFKPQIAGSFEEAPQTLIDYVLRDRRWCQGNLQHLRLLAVPGFHPLSRFHLLQGALSYLMSPAWFVLLVFWAVLGNGEASLVRFFSEENPFFPIWPEESWVNGYLVMAFMYGMLLVPKLMGLLALPATGLRAARLGGTRRFATSVMVELVVSVAFAPILMLQQMIAVLRTAVGYRETWMPQRRGVEPYPLAVLMKFHALETVSGVLLASGIGFGVVSLWMLPIAASLLAAVPLSALSGLNLRKRHWARWHLGTPEVFAPPRVIRRAMARRAEIAQALDCLPLDRPENPPLLAFAAE